MKKPKALPSLRSKLRDAERYAQAGWEKAKSYARDAGEFQARTMRLQSALEERALRVARLEGYIERVHEIERKQPASMAQKDSVDVLRDRIANGPEQQAQAILDALDSKPELMNSIVSNDEPPSDNR